MPPDYLLRLHLYFFDCPVEKTQAFRSEAWFDFANLFLMVFYYIGAYWIWSHQLKRRFSEYSSSGVWEGWSLRVKVFHLLSALTENTWMESREGHYLASFLTLLVFDWPEGFLLEPFFFGLTSIEPNYAFGRVFRPCFSHGNLFETMGAVRPR